MSLRPCQNASSRLTLVLRPTFTTERLATGDFIDLVSSDRLVRIVHRMATIYCRYKWHRSWDSRGDAQNRGRALEGRERPRTYYPREQSQLYEGISRAVISAVRRKTPGRNWSAS